MGSCTDPTEGDTVSEEEILDWIERLAAEHGETAADVVARHRAGKMDDGSAYDSHQGVHVRMLRDPNDV